MARIIFKAEANEVWSKGDIVSVSADGTDLGAKVVLPKFGVVDVPNLLISAVKPYIVSWRFILDYSQVWYSAQKGYRVTVWATQADSIGTGAITQAKIQNYLNRWNCVFQSATQNQIVFDIEIYQSAISEGFWNKDVSDIVFSNVQYVDNTCRISADYSATPYGATPIEKAIDRRSDQIISHDAINKVIVFDIERSNVLNQFKQNVKDTLQGRIHEAKRRYYFTSIFANTVIAAGGVYETNTATLLANIVDRAN